MRREMASLIGSLTLLVLAADASAGRRDLKAACGDASWSIGGGPVTIGSLQIGTLSLHDDGPAIAPRCQLERWAVGGRNGESRLRALFSCMTFDGDELPRYVALRLRARIAAGCQAMNGVLAIRRLGSAIDFSATRTGSVCSSDASCAPEAFCWHPPGDCTATGTCESRFVECFGTYLAVCGCDGQTYDYCSAAAANVSVAHFGACDGCDTNTDCPSTDYCAKPSELCEAHGRCIPRPLGCPDNVDPVCGCDGTTYFNACEAAAAGTNVARAGECAAPCGGIAGIPCPAGQFCELPAGQCGSADLEGRCIGTSPACPEFYAPVCGCDGVTYANDCFRQAAHAQKAHDGACGGCTSLLDCLPNEYCQSPDGQCGGVPGTCTFIAQVCDASDDPVCGCDGETYANRCQATMRAVSIAHAGRCDIVCGGIAGIPCPDGHVCELPAGQCQTADLQGKCVPASKVCPDVYAPVCGCDGVTYGNDCERRGAGAQLAHDGACECMPVCCPPGSTRLDADHDGCAETCSAIPARCVVVDGRLVCPGSCRTACDCYATLGMAFCDDCPLLCPSCGDFWQCKDGACAEQCGVFPPEVYTCTQNTCGGSTGLPCPPGQVCQLPDFGGCGADLTGQCVPIGACTLQYDPVCGCDGKTYGNDCERRNAGVQLAHGGRC